jgi:hypothetical protein
MTPEQQRIAIAEVCGWTEIEPCTCCDGVSRGYTPTPGAHKKHLPNYLNDLNAMHEAEKVLTDDQWPIYRDEIRLVVLGPIRMVSDWCKSDIHSTASQRAEAFLRTIGKWEEAK